MYVSIFRVLLVLLLDCLLTNHFNHHCIIPHCVDFSAHDGRFDLQINHMYLYHITLEM